MAKTEKVIEVFAGAPSMSGGPSVLHDGPNPAEGHPKAFGGKPTISNLRDGSAVPNGTGEQFPSSYGTGGADGTFVKRHIQRNVKGSGDATGAGSIHSTGSLGA